MSLPLVWLSWLPGRVRVRGPGFRAEADMPIPADARFDLRLWAGPGGTLVLRALDGAVPFWCLEPSGAVRPVPPLLGQEGGIEASRCRAHGNGALTVLGGGLVWRLDPGASWVEHPQPPDFEAEDVSLDPHGGWWFAGSVPSRRIPGESREAAVRYWAGHGARFESRTPRLGLLDAARTLRNGGLSRFDAIDAEAEPVVALSSCAWLLEDLSSFVFLFDGQRARVFRLADEIGRFVDRSSGSVRVLTARATVHAWAGTKHSRASFVDVIARALGVGRARIYVLGAAARGERLALAIESTPIGAEGSPIAAAESAVVASEDGGARWSVVARSGAEEGEVFVDVAWVA